MNPGQMPWSGSTSATRSSPARTAAASRRPRSARRTGRDALPGARGPRDPRPAARDVVGPPVKPGARARVRRHQPPPGSAHPLRRRLAGRAPRSSIRSSGSQPEVAGRLHRPRALNGGEPCQPDRLRLQLPRDLARPALDRRPVAEVADRQDVLRDGQHPEEPLCDRHRRFGRIPAAKEHPRCHGPGRLRLPCANWAARERPGPFLSTRSSPTGPLENSHVGRSLRAAW